MNKSIRKPGIDVHQIPSPCFVIEEKLLRNNLRLLQEVSERSGAKILCALKGFSMWSTFPLVKQYLAGATASSLHEAMLCYEEMGTKAHLCCPVYFEHEFDEIASISSHVTFNSLAQHQKFKDNAKKHSLEMAIRINPQYSEVSTALYNPCMPGSRLGVTREQFGDVLPEGITGLHFHALCEQNADALVNTLNKVEKDFADFLPQIKWMNMGGGHHITRADYDVDLLVETIKKFRNKYQVEVILEPGEAVGWQTGYLVTTVQDIIEANGFKTAMLDVSFSAHMPDCLEMPYKPFIWGEVEYNKNLPTYRLGGPTCLSGDFYGDFTFEKELSVGDKLIIDDMIHYTMVKTTTFNGVQHPNIGIWKEDNTFNLVRSFGYADFKSRLS
ncbi:MAG: carboxynorspermidine decarboxylase [Cyclobacteriaceae bacterium]